MGKETKIINESDFSKRFKVCENDSNITNEFCNKF